MSKFLLAALFANARRVDVSKFRVENTAILRLRPRKLIFLLFSKIKGFLRKQLTSDYLSTLKLFMDKKWRKSIFQLLPLDGRYFPTVALCSELKFYFLLDCSDAWELGPKLVFRGSDPAFSFLDMCFFVCVVNSCTTVVVCSSCLCFVNKADLCKKSFYSWPFSSRIYSVGEYLKIPAEN